MAPDHLGVEPRARLWRPLLGRIIDVHDAEALRVAEAPFVVVEERPGVVSAQIDTLTERGVRGAEVRFIVADAKGILDATVDRLRWIVERRPVLGDVKGNASVAISHPLEGIRKAVGIYFPA